MQGKALQPFPRQAADLRELSDVYCYSSPACLHLPQFLDNTDTVLLHISKSCHKKTGDTAFQCSGYQSLSRIIGL